MGVCSITVNYMYHNSKVYGLVIAPTFIFAVCINFKCMYFFFKALITVSVREQAVKR